MTLGKPAIRFSQRKLGGEDHLNCPKRDISSLARCASAAFQLVKMRHGQRLCQFDGRILLGILLEVDDESVGFPLHRWKTTRRCNIPSVDARTAGWIE